MLWFSSPNSSVLRTFIHDPLLEWAKPKGKQYGESGNDKVCSVLCLRLHILSLEFVYVKYVTHIRKEGISFNTSFLATCVDWS